MSGLIQADNTIRFLTINDVYDVDGSEECGGFSWLSSYLKKYRSNTSMFSVSGDFLGGSSLAVALQGAHMVPILSHLQTDVVGIGNHEFDFTEDVLIQRIKDSNFTWLGSNIKIKGERLPKVPLYVIKTFTLQSGRIVRVGIFGTCTHLVPVLSHPTAAVDFQEALQHGVEAVSALRAENVDLIVALTHQSLEEDMKLARKCPQVNLILGGHDHHPVSAVENNVLILKAGQNAEYLGIVDVHVDFRSHEWSFVRTWHNVEIDHTCEHLMQEFRTTAGKMLGKMAGFEDTTELLIKIKDFPMSSKTNDVRKSESSFASLIADAFAWYYRDYGTEVIGMINGGFIRRDKIYSIDSTVAITDILLELPFPGLITLVSITGSLLKELLEQQLCDYPLQRGCHPHTSESCKVRFDGTKMPMDRISEITVNDSVILDNKNYYLVCTSFMASGGDMIDAFKQCTKIKTGKICSAIVVEYLQHLRGDKEVFDFSANLKKRMVDTSHLVLE